LVTEVRQVLRAATGSQEFDAALARASDFLRVLGPLGVLYKSGLGPDFPPRELALAFIGLSGALDLIQKHLPSAGPTGASGEQMAELLDRLATDYEEFLAVAGGVWPGLSATADLVLPPTGGDETPELSVAAAACANGLLRFEPGAFLYRSHREELSGKPLQVLEALARARGNVLTLAALQNQCWGDTVTGEETIRSAIKAARNALRRAIQATGVPCERGFNPLPVVDRGAGRTAWRLQLP
jgi:hypothetical protein